MHLAQLASPGLDGNTLHHGQGFPQQDLGRDGDFYWMTGPDVAVFGPKISGRWGSPVYLKQPIVGVNADAVPMAMGGVEGGGGDGGTSPTTIYTNRVLPAGSGKLAKTTLGDGKVVVNYPGSPNGILSPSGNLNHQANINGWVVKALEELDEALPIKKVDTFAAAGEYDGDMVFMAGGLYVWLEGSWEAVGASESNLDAFTELARKAAALMTTSISTRTPLHLVATLCSKARHSAWSSRKHGCVLQDGEEATTFAEIENIQINKVGQGPYADFSDAKGWRCPVDPEPG